MTLLCSSASAQDGWKTYWKNGTRIESDDGNFAIKIGGRIQVDFSFADPDSSLEPGFAFEDGSEFRRARLFVEGTLYQHVEFKAQYDFAGDAAFKDVYVGLIDLPVIGGVRIGHFKEPFSLEELTSAKYIPFLERSYPVEAFAPSRNMGLMVHNSAAGDRVTWAAGLFKDTDDFGQAINDEWNLTARVTGVAWADDEADSLLHLGLGVSSRSPVDDSARFRARPQAHLAPRLVDTRSFTTDGVDLLGLEAAAVRGPLWAQSEWIQASTSSPTVADFGGWYVQAGWFITGETRPYKRSEGVFDRVKPNADFLSGGGAGAWEVALRYGSLDLSDRLVNGGEQDGFGVALNWYLNPASRLMLDWVSTDLEGSGNADFLLLRLQVDF
jgi:phosphate-selective porin OprO/OprP